MENKDFELIEKYLLGKMSEEERQLFEERLAFDADLREEKEHMEEYILAIEYDHLKEALESYRILGEEAGEESSSSQKEDATRGARIRPLQYWMVAASILLIGWVGYLYYSNLYMRPDQHLEKIFYSDPGLPTVMGENDRYLFYDAMVDYKAGEYEAAIGKWSEISEVGRDTLDYYTGMAWLNMKEWKKSEDVLKQLPEDSSLKDKANWYLVQIYIELGEYEKAVQALELVPDTREGYQEVQEFLSSKTK